VASDEASVYVPGVGFQVTVIKDPEHALRVMLLVSTSDGGTEFAFEMQDELRGGAARAGKAHYGWQNGMQVELRDAAGGPIRRSPPPERQGCRTSPSSAAPARPSKPSGRGWSTSSTSASSLSSSEVASDFSRTWGEQQPQLETIKVIESPQRTDIKFRVGT
jgi:hypothetical protein